MSTTETDKMIEEMASDYAAYAALDLNKDLKLVHEKIEDIQMRLEEFQSILGMMQMEGIKCIMEQIPRFRILRPNVMNLCKKIDALELFVARINLNVAELEQDVENAELTLGMSDIKFAVMNPLMFFKKQQDSASTSRSPSVYRAPDIFKADDFFTNT